MYACRLWLGGAILVAALPLGGAAPSATQQFRAGVDLVRLPVVVTGRDGLLIRGLNAADFEVFEDGVKQTITAFAEGAPGEALPTHLGLLLDGSGSMEMDLKVAADAAVQFVRAFEEAVDVTFLDFDTSMRIGRFTRDGYERLFERIRERKAKGGTKLYDAIGVYLETAVARGGQHVLLLYTDGGDGMSRMSFPQLIEMLRFSNVIVYTLGYLDNQSSSVRGMQQSQLLTLARETGGEAYFPASTRELQSVYARILDELGSRYTLGYESTNPKTDGKFRKVQVRVTAPAAKSANLSTRSGYLAPTPRI
jgi:Ca-activated chloride channel homolog